jgi:uncharacterized protein (TIGR00369 family)
MNLSKLSKAQQRRVEKALCNVPFGSLVGIVLDAVEPGRATMRLEIREELKQNNGVVHGGAIASLIDSTAAFAIIPLLATDETTTTVDLFITYLKPLRGGFSVGTAQVLREGRSIIAVSVEVSDDAGNLAATALTTYMRLKRPHRKSS